MSIEIITPFLTATVNVLKSKTQGELRLGSIEKRTDRANRGALSSVMNLAEEKFEGCFILGFEEQSLLRLAKQLGIKECETINEEVKALLLELSSEIAEEAQGLLKQKGLSCELPKATTIEGAKTSIPLLSEEPLLSIQLKTPEGCLFIETNLKEKTETQS